MSRLQCGPKVLRAIFTCELAIGFMCSMPSHAGQSELTEPYSGIRESTLRYIDFGTPNDLIRLHDAFHDTERELARLHLEVLPERSEQLAEMQQRLEELNHSLTESKTILQLLERSNDRIRPDPLHPLTPEERRVMHGQIESRIETLQNSINNTRQTIRSEEVTYLRDLISERKALTDLLARQRAELLAEYSRRLNCRTVDRTCMHQQLATLCRLRPLLSETERLTILRLIAEIDGRINTGGQSESTSCKNF